MTQERLFSAHHMLLHSAERARESAEASAQNRDYDLLVSLTMCALSIEAFANAAGELIFDDWQDFESASTTAKLRLLADKVQLPFDRAEQPWKEVLSLLKLRNLIAHAKPERVVETTSITVAERNRRRFDIPKSSLEKRLTLGSAKQAIVCTQEAIDRIVQAMPEEQRFEIQTDSWTTSTDPDDA